VRFDHGRRAPADATMTGTGEDFLSARTGVEMARLPDLLHAARILVYFHESIVGVLGFVQRLFKFAKLRSVLQVVSRPLRRTSDGEPQTCSPN
jgi:hypothetical protein